MTGRRHSPRSGTHALILSRSSVARTWVGCGAANRSRKPRPIKIRPSAISKSPPGIENTRQRLSRTAAVMRRPQAARIRRCRRRRANRAGIGPSARPSRTAPRSTCRRWAATGVRKYAGGRFRRGRCSAGIPGRWRLWRPEPIRGRRLFATTTPCWAHCGLQASRYP